MRYFVFLATAVSLLLASACDEDSPPDAGKAPGETDIATAAAQPMSSPPPTTSGSCQVQEPIIPLEYSDVVVNADGNNLSDRMNTRALPADTGYVRYLQLVVDGRSSISIEIAPEVLHTVRPIGGYDVNGDGRDELFVITGNGAYTTWIDVYEYDPATCSLVRLAEPGAVQPQFLVGASLAGASGLRCADGQFVSSRSERTSDEPLDYSGKQTSYVIDGLQLRLVSETSTEPRGSTFDCGLLTLQH